jgi:transposase
VLAELARTDSHHFRVLVPDSDRTKALRALTRAREDLVRTRVALANHLRDELACFWPGASKVFCAVDSPIALALLPRYPSPWPTLAGWASSAWPRSLPVTAIPAASPRASSLAGCATGQKAAPASSRCSPAARSSWPR